MRLARPDEADGVRALVERAYAPWVAVIGRRPAPMDDDYERHIAAGEVFVAAIDGALAAIAVLVTRPDHLLLDNLAVEPARKGQGLGRMMLHFADDAARRSNCHELRLFTHARMQSNIRLYKRFGFQVTGRATVDGFDRVFMRKRLAACDPAPHHLCDDPG